jgi:hypothetical protein
MTRHELAAGRREEVTVHGRGEEPHAARVAGPEDPGVYTFPPVAAAITGGARLLLAMLERQVTQAGGTYAFCDTDSMAIVANEHGGPVACRGGTEATPDGAPGVRALSWPEVDAIRARFEVLKPYDPSIVTADLLELEDENFAHSDPGRQRQELWCYAISAKRYVLYSRKDDGNAILRSWSDVDGGIDIAESDEPADEALVKLVATRTRAPPQSSRSPV